jgi:hypothetical protein
MKKYNRVLKEQNQKGKRKGGNKIYNKRKNQ